MSGPETPEAGTVRCRRCGEAKPPGAFALNGRMKTGRASVCKACVNGHKSPPNPPKGPYVSGGLLPPRPDQRFAGKPGPPLAVVRVGRWNL